LAVIDGLGHGPHAAEASHKAATYIEAHHEQPIDQLVLGCHESLRRTRGVVMAIAEVDHGRGSMTWVAVGNVDGQVVRGPLSREGREVLLQRSGVVGYQLPQLRTRTVNIGPGDLIVMATDGIGKEYSEDLRVGAVNRRADRLLTVHARSDDDALILVAQLRENGS
jgi:negative regulator of sigma-B (phosphoserine phosphatase)